ncbi:MAG: COG1615 family transporter, partial [Acidobacteria bacterium]|nr:COG1615 family transporter [Acidobacteriota bacterium]
MDKRLTWIVLAIALFIVFGGFSMAVEMYFDYLWFVELGKTTLFTTALYAKSSLASGVLLISFLFLYLNFLYANRGPG